MHSPVCSPLQSLLCTLLLSEVMNKIDKSENYQASYIIRNNSAPFTYRVACSLYCCFPDTPFHMLKPLYLIVCNVASFSSSLEKMMCCFEKSIVHRAYNCLKIYAVQECRFFSHNFAVNNYRLPLHMPMSRYRLNVSFSFSSSRIGAAKLLIFFYPLKSFFPATLLIFVLKLGGKFPSIPL